MSQKVNELKAHLLIVKKSPADKIDQDYYNFMNKAKDSLGETSYHMGMFYYQYGNFLLEKIEASNCLFNEQAIPNNVDPHQQGQYIASQYESSEGQNQQEQVNQVEVINGGQQDQPQIIEDAPVQPNGGDQQKEENEEANDKDISLCNFWMASRLYEQELDKVKKGLSETKIDEVLDGLRRTNTRLGDLYMLEEDYPKGIELYQKVIERESEREGFDSNYRISQIYYLIGNCYLCQNGSDCETKAISEFLKAVNILLSHLSITLNYDISAFDIPSEAKTKVDRFCYMCLAGDNEEVKEVKDVIGSMLDKIDDAQSQLEMKETFIKEKLKMVEEQKLSEFKEVADPSKVVHLGSFGNRKRKHQEAEQVPSQDGKNQSTRTTQSSKESNSVEKGQEPV